MNRQNIGRLKKHVKKLKLLRDDGARQADSKRIGYLHRPGPDGVSPPTAAPTFPFPTNGASMMNAEGTNAGAASSMAVAHSTRRRPDGHASGSGRAGPGRTGGGTGHLVCALLDACVAHTIAHSATCITTTILTRLTLIACGSKLMRCREWLLAVFQVIAGCVLVSRKRYAIKDVHTSDRAGPHETCKQCPVAPRTKYGTRAEQNRVSLHVVQFSYQEPSNQEPVGRSVGRETCQPATLMTASQTRP